MSIPVRLELVEENRFDFWCYGASPHRSAFDEQGTTVEPTASQVTCPEQSASFAEADPDVAPSTEDVRPELEAEAFEHFPHGILVTARSGRILMGNRAAQELLGCMLSGEGSPTTCCEVFGCRRPGGPLENSCLTELAAYAGTRIPEIRVDLVGASTSSAAWVTAAPLDSRVIFSLRPGDRGDRRRRTDPHWTQGPVLRIFALGRLRVESVEGHIGGRWLNQRSGQLLKLLITERRRVVPADELAHALWPEAGISGLGNVRYFVHAARDQLEPDRRPRMPSSFIVARDGGYTLDAERLDIDVDRFERHARAGARAFAEGEVAAATARLEEALALYRGEFLADEPYAEWVLAERDRLHTIAGEGLRMLAHIRLAEEDLSGALEHVNRLAEMDAFDLDVQRTLIALCLRTGRRSEAVRRYDTLRKRMLSAFGEVPEFELADLADADLAWLAQPRFAESAGDAAR